MKRIIITGVSSGLGYEIAKIYLKNGFEVIGISRTKPNLDIIHLKTNLTKEEDIIKTTDIIKEEYSNFSYLINCAGILYLEKLGEINYKNSENILKLNALAPIIVTSNLINLIKENESDIINIISTIGSKAYEKHCVYGASKWAMEGATKNFQLELKGTNSRVISISPFKSRLFEKATKNTNDKVNISNFMEVKEIAKLVKQIIDLPKNMEVSNITINRK